MGRTSSGGTRSTWGAGVVGLWGCGVTKAKINICGTPFLAKSNLNSRLEMEEPPKIIFSLQSLPSVATAAEHTRANGIPLRLRYSLQLVVLLTFVAIGVGWSTTGWHAIFLAIGCFVDVCCNRCRVVHNWMAWDGMLQEEQPHITRHAFHHTVSKCSEANSYKTDGLRAACKRRFPRVQKQPDAL